MGPSGATGAEQPPVVVYIAGSGRSGSTLVERALGAIPGFVNVGELIDLFRRVIVDNERCGCGEAFSSCPYWVGVGAAAFGSWDSEAVGEIRRLQRRVARQRYMLPLLTAGSQQFREDLRRYRALQACLYRAILQQASAQVVVDASKWPAQALALRGPEIDLKVLHLVRDVRGVAYSMSKRDVARPHAVDHVNVMATGGPAVASARWMLTQTEIDLMRLRRGALTRLRYEDFVMDAESALGKALDEVGVQRPPQWANHIGGSHIDLPVSHGLSGNPSRFVSGVVPLRLDEAWRSQMSHGVRALVTAISLPHAVAAGSVPVLARRCVRERETMSVQPDDTSYGAATEASLPAVTVVLPTRGRPELVRAAVAAVVAQDYKGPIECLVVHDQEDPDPSLVDLGVDGHKVTSLTNRHTPGLAGARNTGLDVATGDFIATCDDDDVWHSSKLTKQLALMRHEPDLLVVGSGIRLLFPEGRVVEWPGRSPRITQDTLLRNRVKELHSSTLLMRRDAFAKAGRYDEALPHGYAEDYDWVLRAVRVGSIGVVIEPLADIRKDVQSWFRERAENTAEALSYLLEAHPEIKTSRRGHSRVLGQIAYAEACLGHRRAALQAVAKSLRRYPAAPHAYLALAQASIGLDPRLTLRAARIFKRGLS